MPTAAPEVSFVWLEISGKCQLECLHCYAESSPSGSHGAMTAADWRRVIDEAVAMGVEMVQFIGGEPTLHPDFADLVAYALDAGVEVEVFSNLVRVTPALWALFERPGVSLACSYYSDDAVQHAAITGRKGSYARTKANIAEAVRRGIPLRAGVIDLDDEQRVDAALAELEGLGVTDVGTDRLRQVGRGIRDQAASVEQLCGNCGQGVLAVAPDGTVWPCVFTRWMSTGNVLETSLADVVAGEAMAARLGELGEAFAAREVEACRPNCGPTCEPSRCAPTCQPSCRPACNPTCAPRCGPSCNPCQPSKKCWPDYGGCNPQKCRPNK